MAVITNKLPYFESVGLASNLFNTENIRYKLKFTENKLTGARIVDKSLQ